ncbi:hypothetical protein DSO57_1014144 [Entomophthora muscae]|uniref:Uncharacterized protein n=1 Tax=Entomophthora muscae TaxID=34485 RepID=A0ACC2S795_9FUNG|nr:hypothetical protein DSO57_1014144 [Entomophthora muscae]
MGSVNQNEWMFNFNSNLKCAEDAERIMLPRPLYCCCYFSLRIGTLAAALLLALTCLVSIVYTICTIPEIAVGNILIILYKTCAALVFVGSFVGALKRRSWVVRWFSRFLLMHYIVEIGLAFVDLRTSTLLLGQESYSSLSLSMASSLPVFTQSS